MCPCSFLSVDTALVSKLLDEIPIIGVARDPSHNPSNLADGTTMDRKNHVLEWSYFSTSGELRVLCTRTDSRGVTWSQY